MSGGSSCQEKQESTGQRIIAVSLTQMTAGVIVYIRAAEIPSLSLLPFFISSFPDSLYRERDGYRPTYPAGETDETEDREMSVLDGTYIRREFSDQGVDCYRLLGREFRNEYYIVSEAETRKLLDTPEIVGYEVYRCMVPATSQMMYYFKDTGRVTTANILSILRGALNYPLEESCYREHIRVHDISFLSSERIFDKEELKGLEIKYSKLTMVPGSTLLIGDIIASGETLTHCLNYVISYYRENGASLRNIIIFTIGGTRGIEILEELTSEIRGFWPEFEGFIMVYYEGIFSTYQDQGVSGVNIPNVDFYWKGGIVAPEFRKETLASRDPLFEKCVIYDGGARRYEIHEHIEEVLGFWNHMLERSGEIDFEALKEEKLGHALPISFDDWLRVNHYTELESDKTGWLYRQEQGFIGSLEGITLREIAEHRIAGFSASLHKYIL